MEPAILERPKHPISRDDFSMEARKVLYRLKDRGYLGYLAGGCVRDLLLNRKPKDFDVATNATPQQVKRTFRNCRLIGRRFRLAHIYFNNGEIIEVATFRAAPPSDDNVHNQRVKKEDGLILRDNLWGNAEQDALRRDFTINALFYSIADYSIIDYVGGLKDVERRLVRCIGDPDERYVEDPVRMLRAIRFAGSLDLNIEEKTRSAISQNRNALELAAPARLFEELLKILNSGGARKCFALLKETGLLEILLPDFGSWYQNGVDKISASWIHLSLDLFDSWKKNNQNPDASLLLTLLFHPFHKALAEKENLPLSDAVHMHQQRLAPRVLISQKDTYRIIQILRLQTGFPNQNRKWANRIADRGDFSNAFIFFKFFAQRNEEQKPLLAWWQENMPHNASKKSNKKARRFQRERPYGKRPANHKR